MTFPKSQTRNEFQIWSDADQHTRARSLFGAYGVVKKPLWGVL